MFLIETDGAGNLAGIHEFNSKSELASKAREITAQGGNCDFVEDEGSEKKPEFERMNLLYVEQ